jgi:zinc D-Ala-D-Ala carboxypeptidase
VGLLLACLALSAVPEDALAYPFSRVLARGDRGQQVKALEIRVVGWFPRPVRKTLHVNRRFGRRTVRAVKAFQRRYGLTVDGIAGPQTFGRLDRLQDRDGSTAHFEFGEFKQHRNSGCSRRANRHAGTFRGGRVGRHKVRRSVKRLMWRLEAIRAKAHGRPVEVVSGFRSVAYNRCIGGATLSQHLYGTAVDIKIARVGGHRERRLARRSQIHGLECYSSLAHNHLDIRIENPRLPDFRHWYWPERDRWGRDLTSDSRVCKGERRRRRR